MGVLKLVLLVLVGALAVAAIVAGGAFVSDAKVQATVVDKQCPTPTPFGSATGQVTVRTKLFGIRYTVTDIASAQCALVQSNNFVEYHLRSQRTSLWQREGGSCIWDSVHGLNGCAL